MSDSSPAAALLDLEPSSDVFLDEVLSGLRSRPRHLPCKYLYDERGSRLFDQICELDEYYPTRTELGLVRRYGREMADQIDRGVMLVEYGSGSSIKTRILLDHLSDPVAYVPVDISREHLCGVADRLSQAYPHIEILPVCADFTQPFDLPESKREPTHRAVYFPGSTIGNFEPCAAQALLRGMASLCGPGGGVLLGIDLEKDAEVLEAAYNDSDGVTARFNLNLLRRINRELDADIDPDAFEHRAVYNRQAARVEMHLVSRRDQDVRVADQSFRFREGESICTEHSHKFTIPGFARIAAEAGLELHRHWTDEDRLFAVLHCVVREGVEDRDDPPED